MSPRFRWLLLLALVALLTCRPEKVAEQPTPLPDETAVPTASAEKPSAQPTPSTTEPVVEATGASSAPVTDTPAPEQDLPQASETAAPAEPAPKILTISTYPSDGGYVTDVDVALDVGFSRAIDPAGFAFSITPDPRGWSVTWREEGLHATLEHENPFEAGVEYELVVTAAAEGLEKVVRFWAYGPTSFALIDAAAEKGAVDLDTAWTYRLQALFEPGKLPAEFKSVTPTRHGTMLMRDFRRLQDQLDPATVEALRPYLVRPDHPASVFASLMAQDASAQRLLVASSRCVSVPTSVPTYQSDRPTGMEPVDCGAHIRIWHQKGAAYQPKAVEACQVVIAEAMWEKFAKVMWDTPLDDTRMCPGAGEEGREDCLKVYGGDSRVDIYLVPGTHAGLDRDWGWCTSDEDAGAIPAYILVDRGLVGVEFWATLAHELFHAFQFALDSDEAEWWMESTATWAEHHINATWNLEQEDLPDAFEKQTNSLISVTREGGNHEYAVYLLPLFLDQKYGPETIGAIWGGCFAVGAVESVKVAVEKGWDGIMKEFAMWCLDWGKEYRGRFKDQPMPLSLYHHHEARDWRIEEEDKIQEPEIDLELEPLSARYMLAINLVTDPDVASIRFLMDDFKENDKLTVQAMVGPKDGGDPFYEDWSDKRTRQFCINREDEDFDYVYIIVASSDPTQTYGPKLYVETSPECWEWEGSFTYGQSVRGSWDCESHGSGSVGIAVSSSFDLGFVAPAMVEGIPLQNPMKYVDTAPTSQYSIVYDYSSEDTNIHQVCEGSFYPTGWRLLVDYEEGTYDLYDFSFYLKDGTCGRLERTFLEFSDSFYLGDAGFLPVAKGQTDGQTISGSWSSPVVCSDWCGYHGWLTPRPCGITADWHLNRLVERDNP